MLKSYIDICFTKTKIT